MVDFNTSYYVADYLRGKIFLLNDNYESTKERGIY
jgi:hypothetical protein